MKFDIFAHTNYLGLSPRKQNKAVEINKASRNAFGEDFDIMIESLVMLIIVSVFMYQ